jgi:tetratricopeptide (TPR) repeat protein
MTLDLLLGSCAVQLADQVGLANVSGGGVPSAILRGLRTHPFSIASAALLDIAGHLLPASKRATEAAVKALADELAAERPDVLANQLIEAARRDLLGGLFALLDVLANNSITGALIIDGIEQGSTSVQSAVSALLRRAPVGWTVLCAINDETPEGIAAFNTIWPEVAAAGVDNVQLGPLDAAALDSWTRFYRGSAPSQDVLERVLNHCGGRPLHLSDWVHGRSIEAERQWVTSRLGPYYDARLRSLPVDARRLVRQVSLLPESWHVSLELCSTLLDESDTDALSVVDELCAAHFLEPLSSTLGSYRFVHEVAHVRVRETLPDSVAREGASALLAALGARTSVADRYAKARLAAIAGHSDALLSDGIATGNELIEAGSVRPALEVYRLTLAAAEPAGERRQQAEARLGIAEVLLHTGFYHDALDILETVDETPLPQRGKRSLLQGQAHIRLNSYEAATDALQRATDDFAQAGDEGGRLSALREQNTILRDLGRYQEAVEHAEMLLSQASAGSTLLRAACHRALARSLALSGRGDEGLEHAHAALRLADSAGSTRAVGNARLAAGECLRHAGHHNDAASEYRAAIGIAAALANRDSLLWSQLGLADALLLSDRRDEAASVLDEVAEVVETGDSRYPLEYCHWRLSKAVVDFLAGTGSTDSVRTAAGSYEILGVRWPIMYVDALIEGEAPPGPKPL